MRALVRLRATLVLVWAVLLLLLVPFFFLNFGGRWLQRVAEIWPLKHA